MNKQAQETINKQVQDSIAVLNGSTDNFGQHQAASRPSSNSCPPVQRLKIGKKATEEVNVMLLASLKEKAIKWRKAYECEDSNSEGDISDMNCENESTVTNSINMPTKEECENSYLQLTKDLNTKSKNDNSPSVLLPAYSPPLQKVNIQVEGDDGLTNVSAKFYIDRLMKERDEALLSAQLFRNQVDQLRSKNRKLYCEMHDRIDTIRNFWRNNIAEGSSRPGLCVKMAVLKQKSQQ